MTQEQFNQEKMLHIGLKFLRSLLDRQLMTQTEYDTAVKVLREKYPAPIGSLSLDSG